jgi:cytochrome c oxidase cbb3-type subunit 3
MRSRIILAVLPLALALAGCSRLPGAAAAAGTAQRPDQLMDFKTLYSQNCQGCHGANGRNGPAIDHSNPELEALLDDAALRRIISSGLPGTQMPAFAQSAGGMLTDAQIGAIIAGMRKNWAKPDPFGGAVPPPLQQPAGGDAKHGAQVYQARCASCHQKPEDQQVTSPAYLSLVSDEVLRTIIIAGRPDIGQPDWRMQGVKGSAGPLSAQDVTDLVTYLGSLRNPSLVSAGPVGR